MDHCKIGITVPLSGDKVTKGGVLAMKLPFEDFSTELEVASSVEKVMLDGNLLENVLGPFSDPKHQILILVNFMYKIYQCHSFFLT